MPPRHVIRERLQTLVHLLTAMTIFIKGMTKLEHPEGYWPLIIFLFAGGTVILALTILHHRLHLPDHVVDITTYFIEALVLTAVAYLYWKDGSWRLAVVTCFAIAGFLVACGVRWVKRGGPKPAHGDVTARRS